MTRRAPLSLLLLLCACATGPKPVAPPTSPSGPTPVPTPGPSAAPVPSATPVAAAVTMLPVPEPRLDVAIATDRTVYELPAGDWIVSIGGSVSRRAGPLRFTPRPSPLTPLFSVQAGSFAARAAAETQRERLTALLGVEGVVADVSGRFGVRLGVPAERKAAEQLLARVRREAVPDAFLVGATATTELASYLVLEENGRAADAPSPVEIASAAERAGVPTDAATVPLGDAAYRGHLLVRATGRGTLHVVDRVNLEQYLRGVVPAEMGPKVYDELEALKAQTLAARTYALRRRGEFAAEGYDLCATPRCQVYGGVRVEQPLTDQAIEETAGEVLLWDGRLAETLFTSTCGGRTERAGDVFPSYANGDFPYLVPAICSGEKESVLSSTFAAARPGGLLAMRGRALLASVSPAGDLAAARKALRERLGLPAGAGPASFSAAAVYTDLAQAAAFGELANLVEASEAAGPASWSKAARQAYAVALRFQLGGGSLLPADRAFRAEEIAGLWAALLSRLGDLEEVEGRFVAVEGRNLTVKTAKGRAAYPLAAGAALYRGGPDVFDGVTRVPLVPGDRIRLFVRGGVASGLAATVPAAAGTYERDSSWIHWTRRATGAELAQRIKERDAGRTFNEVRHVEVLERGESGRAKRARITTDGETLVLTGLEIRFALGLPETLFNVVGGKTAAGTVFTFYGRGWGHGVGLCQNGAFGMAIAGHGYRAILSRYYPGTSVGPVPGRI